MRIHEVELSNFSSFQRVHIKLLDAINVIVGENNVGKSNFLRAIDFLRGLPTGSIPKTWWPEGKPFGTLSANMTLELDSKELKDIENNLRRDSNYKVSEPFHDSFGTFLDFKISWSHPDTAPQLELLFKRVIGKPRARVLPSLGNIFAETKEGPVFGSVIYNLLRGSLDQCFISFPEFRQRPGITANEVLKSTIGTDVASVLFLLKNGEREDQHKFRMIKRYFSLLFPTLRMEVSKPPNSQPRILVEKKSIRHELPLDWIGAGIAEMIIILTHIVSERHKVILLDEPELHLHPHSQRLLLDFLRQASVLNQIIIVTHSPQFVDLRDVGSVVIIREIGARSDLMRLPKDFLSLEETKKISSNLLAQEKEFLFSRSVLLVEGPTEYGAVPILAKRMHKSFDESGVTPVSVEGNYFGLMLKLLDGFDFSWVALCDQDALMNISRGRITQSGNSIKTSPLFNSLYNANLLSKSDIAQLRNAQTHIKTVNEGGKSKEIYAPSQFPKLNRMARRHSFEVLVPDFEGLFAQDDHGRLIRLARENHGTNKRLQGVYLAENVKKIPVQLQRVISQVSTKRVATSFNLAD